MISPSVQILLATYNGGLYISELLDSLCNQSYSDFELLVSDDGSNDNTLHILKEFENRLSIHIVGQNIKRGSSGNFYHLLDKVSSPLVMLCDQDDVWLPTKVESSVKAIAVIAEDYKLCFGDMVVVDQNLNKIGPSFLGLQKLDPEWVNQRYIPVVQSLAAGCTMIFSKSLVDKLRSFPPDNLFQHDHYLLLQASWYGKIGFIPGELILYRQHDKNQVGAHQIDAGYFGKKLFALNQVFARWSWLRMNLQPKPSRIKLIFYKFYISLLRIFAT